MVFMTYEEWNFNGRIVKGQWKCAVSFSPYSVVAAVKAIVAGEDDQGIFYQFLLLKLFHDPSYIMIHGGHRGKISCQAFS